jgi:tetratricopeptide (TPR) repeat protein
MIRLTSTYRLSLKRRASLLVFAVTALGALGLSPVSAKSPQDLPPGGYLGTFSGSYLAGHSAYFSMKDFENAASYYRNALAADPNSPFLIERTFLLLVADGRIKDALPLAERILQRDKGNEIARLVLGVDALKRGQFERARAQFAQMPVRPLTDLTAGILTAWAFAGQGDADQAFRIVDRLAGPDWYGVFKSFHSGLIAEVTNRKAEAGKRLGAAYKSDPNALRVTDAAARALARAGKSMEAAGLLDNFEKVIPDHPLIAATRAEIVSGVAPAPLVDNAQEGASELLYGLGAAVGRDGGEERAAIYINLSLWLDPKAELPLVTLATLQGQLKHYEQSIELLEKIPADSKIRGMVDIQIGRYYNVLSKYDEARQHLQASIDKNPRDVDAVMALGDVLRANKQFTEAAEVYSKAVALIGPPQKNDWSLFYYRGISYERSKQWPKAEADFYKALELNPNEAHVLNYLGYTWIDMGVNLEKGLDLVKQAVELKPDDGYIVDSLGWAYYKLGRYEDATRELERAVLLRPSDPVINDHLGDAYWKVGRELEASFQWSHARDLKPEPEDLVRIEKKLKNGLRDEPTAPSASAAEPAKVPSPQ